MPWPVDLLKDNISVLPVAAPLCGVLWQAVFLHLVGSRRHWRTFGLSLYVGGFTLYVGGVLRTDFHDAMEAMACMVIAVLIGALVAFVALLVRENESGDLVYTKGDVWARRCGLFCYFFACYLVLSVVSTKVQ